MLLLAEKHEYANNYIEHLRDRFDLIAIVQRRDHNVSGVELIRPAHRRALDRLRTAFNRWHTRYLPDANIQAWLALRMSEHPYDLLVGRYLRPTVRSGALSHSPVVVDVDDLDAQTYLSMTGIPGVQSSELRKRVRRAKALDRATRNWLPRASHLWVTNEHDRRTVGPDRATILPNIPLSPPAEPSPPKREATAVFIVTSIKHHANARAIQRFVHHVWPQIKSRCPSAVLHIAGSNMTPRQKADWSSVPGVQPLGLVDDLQAAYADCAFAAVPIYEGGGTKIKILEALSHGRTCVVTRHSHRGFEDSLSDGKSLLVADDEDQFAEACVRLLSDPELRDALASRGHAEVTRRFTYPAFERIIADTINRICPAF